MTNTLQDILATLSSDKARIRFLHGAYTPGNEEIADTLLTITTDQDILEKETSFALKHGQTTRFETLAKKLIDMYAKEGWSNTVSSKVIEWGNIDIAQYALAKIPNEKGSMIPDEYENAITIAKHFNMPEKATDLLETKLLHTKDSFDRRDVLLQLQKYNQILDEYVSNPSQGETNSTLNIAEEHVPERVTEIAEVGYTQNKPLGYPNTLVRCAKIIGKEEEARKIVVAHAKQVDKDKAPSMYDGLVKALVALNEQEQARKLVEKVASKFNKQEGRQIYEQSDHLAELYGSIGRNDMVKTIYEERVQFIVDNHWAIGNIQHNVQEARKLLGPNALLEEELIFYELSGNYAEAARVATQMGNETQAANYLVMESMIPNKTE